MSAPVGNTNNADAKRFRMALHAALERKGTDKWKALTDVAEKLIDEALTGNISAIKEVADRIEGKSSQGIELTGRDGGPVEITERVVKLVGGN